MFVVNIKELGASYSGLITKPTVKIDDKKHFPICIIYYALYLGARRWNVIII